jgi:bud emergence protein 1
MSTPIGVGPRVQSGALSPTSSQGSQGSGPRSPKPSVFYAVVMHDFMAERPDELDAKAGDMISVVAQSNREWFVAKPIGRLGGPGLIPVSFVEVRDPATGGPIADVDGMIDRSEIPRVEEWKKATMDYKARSIPLGKIEDDVQVVNSQFQNMTMQSPVRENPPGGFSPTLQHQHAPSLVQQYPQNGHQQPTPPNGSGLFDEGTVDYARLEHVRPLPPGTLIRAEVSSFHQEEGDHHYRINATFQPDPPSISTSPFDSTPLMARELTLFRVYEDFYVFQIKLLEEFPLEAGRDPDHPHESPDEDDEEAARRRILPYMPGPQDDVDDVIADSRRGDLDVYLKELVALRNMGAVHILRCDLIRKFFAARDRDIENEVEMEPEDDYVMPNAADYGYYEREPETDRIPLHEYDMMHDDQPRTNGSNGSYMGVTELSSQNRPQHPYAQHGRRPSGSSTGGGQVDRSSAASSEWNTGGTYSGHPYGRDHHTSGNSSFGAASPGGVLRSPPVYQGRVGYNDHSNSKHGSTLDSPNLGSMPPMPRDDGRDSSANTSSFYSNPGQPPLNTTNPPISASNPNTAFVKIKIFHSSTDELIAIRVSPRVALQQLMDKVRERLGSDIEGIKYRDGQAGGGGGPGGWVDIFDDIDLKKWVASGDKLVLYAE